LDKEHSYCLSEIKEALDRIFGQSVAEKLLDLIEEGIKAQYYH
jgi:hypothetical protein